jgi:hypothetical protein
MNVYTEVYEKCVDQLKTQCLDDSWKTIEVELKQLLDPTGPSSAKSSALDNLRAALKKATKGKAGNDAVADEILRVCGTSKAGVQDRAALVKTMAHTYMVQKKGNQSVWVVDPPKSFTKWPHDQLAGKSLPDLKAELQAEEEVFGAANRKMMSDAHQLARKWSADVQVKLSNNDAAIRTKVNRWFLATGVSKSDIDKAVGVLQAGFKKIHATCNSTSVIFSDRPHLRASGDYDSTFASVNAGDQMPVIYIYQLFLQTGRRNIVGMIPKLWLCAETVIHELSHKLLNTEDFSYDDDGLLPGGVSLAADNAIKNADSWGYFAADVAGLLSKGTVQRILR